ncbi:MAG: 6-carboxytetrahydropterin synthase, partial [Alphaproteobacteria bacterium]
LNKIEGLDRPTLERLAEWLWLRLKPGLPELSQIRIWRGASREGCVYRGPASGAGI